MTCALHSAHLPALKEVRPDSRDLHAPVLQDVLHRLDTAFAACFRRVQAGAHPGSPRLPGTDRYTSCTSPQVGAHGGAALDAGMLSLATIRRIPMRRQRPRAATPKTVTVSREADGW